MITTRLKGGLGNQMFQYALGRALSLEHVVPLTLDLGFLLSRSSRSNFTPRNYGLDVFNISAEIIKEKENFLKKICRKVLPLPGKEKFFSFDPKILKLGPNVYLDGYWQSPKYFEKYAEIIRKDFTLEEPLVGKSAELLEEIKNCASVGIHVRRGDYVGNARHPVLDESYYKRGLEYISRKSKIDKIYIFSDDMGWCKENLQFNHPTAYVGTEHAGKYGEGHMVLMSNCKNFVIANSTFSWWGAWLAQNPDKTVVAPQKWFFDPKMDTNDLILDGWIRL